MTKQEWRGPTPKELESRLFNTIWNAIKTWDVNVPEQYNGYCGTTGNHVCAIMDVIPLAHRAPNPMADDMLMERIKELEAALSQQLTEPVVDDAMVERVRKACDAYMLHMTRCFYTAIDMNSLRADALAAAIAAMKEGNND